MNAPRGTSRRTGGGGFNTNTLIPSQVQRGRRDGRPRREVAMSIIAGDVKEVAHQGVY